MSSSLFIPTDVLETLLCVNCSNYLSIFPIYTKIDSTGALCGRCKMVEETNFIRDEAYEGIAQFLVFPCQYTSNGCNENLTPLNLEDHEQCCRFRKFYCPSKLYSKCQWTGARVDLLEHFTEKHSNLSLTTPQFELNFNNSLEESCLMTYNDEVFVIKKEIDARKCIFFCSIEHLISTEESDNYSYFLKLETKDKNYFFKCADKSTCKDEKLNSTQITADMVKERLQDSTAIIVNIEIFKTRNVSSVVDEEESAGDLPKNIQKNPNINWDLLAEIECPICYDFMLPPIYQCVNGHSICEVCKQNLNTNVCGSCKADVKDTRNFTLENMTNRLIYPCKYHKSGCLHTSPGTKIKEHEMSCELGPHTCPVSEITNCTWKENYSELASHIENNHNENFLNGDKVDCPFDKNNTTSKVVYLIKYNGNIFKLCYKFDGLKFYWCVQLVGPSNIAKNYRFEIDLIDLSGLKLRCYHMGLVTSISKEKDCFKKAGKYVFAPLEQVESFVTDTLSFRVRVIKE